MDFSSSLNSLQISDEEDDKLRICLERFDPRNIGMPRPNSNNDTNTSFEVDSLSFQETTQNSIRSADHSELFISSEKCTNPFRSATYDDNVTDAQSFLESVLSAGQHLLNSCDEVNNPCTNPFLDDYIEIENATQCSAKETSLAVNPNPFVNGYVELENTTQCLLPSEIFDNTKETVQAVSPSDTDSSSINMENDILHRPVPNFQEFINDTTLIDHNECAISNYFEKRTWKVGEFIPLRISNIYHPNRFWIVPRYRELEIFMEYLSNFYSQYKNNYKVSQVSLNLYCVVSFNNLYYRAIIVSFIPNDPHKVKVFLFDYGTILLVFIDEVYYLQEKLYRIPQFAVRASLSYICPKDHQTWMSEVVRVFDDFASNKVLIGQVINIDSDMKCLEMNIGEFPADGFTVVYINELLIQEGYAKYIFNTREPNPSEYVSKVKHLYLFPTFDLIESGKVASSVYHFEALKGTIAFDVLYNQYCTL